MIKKVLISLAAIFISLYATICYASSVEITKEDLNTAFQKMMESADNNMDGKVSVDDKIITINLDDGKYKINYDLTDKPTFSYEVEVKQGMSYNEVEEKTNELGLPIIGYAAVAKIKGIELEDSMGYIGTCLFEGAFSQLSSMTSNGMNNTYIIVSDETTVTTSGNQKVIKESEFGNYVMEYINSVYGEKNTYADTSGFNTFEWTYEIQDATDTSCKLVSTLVVDTEADFSKLEGYGKNLSSGILEEYQENKNLDSINNKINNTNLNETNTNTSAVNIKNSTTSEDKTISKTILPKTGIYTTILIASIIFICIISVVLFGMKNRKYKDIK